MSRTLPIKKINEYRQNMFANHLRLKEPICMPYLEKNCDCPKNAKVITEPYIDVKKYLGFDR